MIKDILKEISIILKELTMNKDIKGLCLFLGMIGLVYAAILILTMLLTGVKILKSIVFISAFSSFLVSLGLTPQVKQRLVQVLKRKSEFYKMYYFK
jgi:hypothetical protein